MRLISIDQSYTKSGIVVFDSDEMIHFELYSSNPDDSVFQRAWNIASYIAELATKYQAEEIAIEGLAFGSSGNVTRNLAGLQFTIVTKLQFENGLNVEIIPPTSVKKVATGNGKAKKMELFESLPEKIQKKFLDIGVKKTTGLLDLTDGYWIGKAFMENKKPNKKTRKNLSRKTKS